MASRPIRQKEWSAFPLFLFALIQFGFLATTGAFSGASSIARWSSLRISSALNVLAEPPKDSFTNKNFTKVDLGRKSNPTKERKHKFAKNRQVKLKRKNPNNKKEDVWSSGRWHRAVAIEKRLLEALEGVEQAVKRGDSISDERHIPAESRKILGSSTSFDFPGIRECNAALAAFGDGEDLLRALRLYFKMRKAASLSQRYCSGSNEGGLPVVMNAPIPTLVTYSTLMSRAVQLGKPLIAIRIWNIMKRQTDFFSAVSSIPNSRRIVPDVKAANILMNCYAKLGYMEAAEDLLSQMVQGDGEDVPMMTPNLVTFNTLLDACQKARELDNALYVKHQLNHAGMAPDARTYTTLIATVARKASDASGANDPTMAFLFLEEMKNLGIRPNGMTYSALIDVCGRCQRSDLALKGLRLMLDQKAEEQEMLALAPGKRHTLPAEVGAWTAAINACGKAGRIETALKLFYSMPKYDVFPNTITCGCLTDSLLRNGRTAESLDILRYMKKYKIAPSEVMYTSLMTSACGLAQFENRGQSSGTSANHEVKDVFPTDSSGATSAVEVYTELMTSLMHPPKKRSGVIGRAGISSTSLVSDIDKSNEVYRVSLVFQEMKAAGVEPDLACYNAILKSCANAGDVTRALETLEHIRDAEDMEPNEKTWREVIRAAGKANRIDVALSTWKDAVNELKDTYDESSETSTLSAQSLATLFEALLRGTADANIDSHTRQRLYQVITKACEALISGTSYLGMDLVDRESVLSDQRTMIIFLRALVALEGDTPEGHNSKKFRLLAISVVASDCFEDGLPSNFKRNAAGAAAFQIAQTWLEQEITASQLSYKNGFQ